MAELALNDDGQLRRWAISAVAVVLVHGAIVAGLLTWPGTEPTGSVMIDLPPIPAAGSAAGDNLEPHAAAPQTTVETIKEATNEAVAAKSDPNIDQKRAEEPLDSPTPFSPEAVASSSAAGENGADTSVPTASGGGRGALTGGLGNPIDTRIADPRLSARFSPRFRSAVRADNPKNPFMIVRPGTKSGPHQLPRSEGATASQTSSGGAGSITRNAIGLSMPGPAGGKGPVPGLHAAPEPNAIGAKVSAGAAAETNTANRTPANAIGMTVVSHSNAAGENAATGAYSAGTAGTNGVANPEHPGTAGVAGSHPGITGIEPGSGIGHVGAVGNAASIGTINGTNLIRLRTRIGVIGGPAKNVGVLNGTTLRHP